MKNEEYITRIVEQDEDFCIITDEVNGTVNIEVSLDWWKKQSNSDEDCISRKQAMKACYQMAVRTGIEEMPYKYAETELAHLPSVQPTAKENLVVEDCISRKSLKHKLQKHHDFFVDAYGGFSNLPPNDKSRVDEITNCIAMVVNEPSIQPKTDVIDKIRDEIERKAHSGQWSDATVYGMLKAVAIVDKYKAEKETE